MYSFFVLLGEGFWEVLSALPQKNPEKMLLQTYVYVRYDWEKRNEY